MEYNGTSPLILGIESGQILSKVQLNCSTIPSEVCDSVDSNVGMLLCQSVWSFPGILTYLFILFVYEKTGMDFFLYIFFFF